jgi:hypothetical protein
VRIFVRTVISIFVCGRPRIASRSHALKMGGLFVAPTKFAFMNLNFAQTALFVEIVDRATKGTAFRPHSLRARCPCEAVLLNPDSASIAWLPISTTLSPAWGHSCSKMRHRALATSHHLRAERVLTLPLRDQRGLKRVALLRHPILEDLTVLHINGWIQSQPPRWTIPNLGMVGLNQ